MTECEEIAESIWRSRSVTEGNGLNVTMPIRTYADAMRIAIFHCADQGTQVIANVAEALWQRAQRSQNLKRRMGRDPQPKEDISWTSGKS